MKFIYNLLTSEFYRTFKGNALVISDYMEYTKKKL